MDQLKQLARDVWAYHQELEGRNMPPGLTWQLVRDYQQARCRALYGGSDQAGDDARSLGTLHLQASDDGKVQLVLQRDDDVEPLKIQP